MKKILFYVNSLNKGGAERVLMTICNRLKEEYEIVILTDCYADREYELPKGIRRIVISEEAGEITNPVSRLLQIRKFCNKENPNLIIAFMISSAIRAILANFLSGNRVAAAVRSNPYDEFGSVKKRLFLNGVFQLSSGVICQTEYQKAFFNKSIQKKCSVILNPLSNSFLQTEPAKERDNRIVSVGRLYDYKNHKMLIQAFSQIADGYPQMRLEIYGDGPYREETQQLIHRLGLEEKVSLPGDVEDVAAHIKTAAMFVLPSDTEGMPNALMEAMALGIPCISTDCPCGGPRTLIEEGVNGCLCKVNQVKELAEKMKFLLDHKETAAKLGKNAEKISKTCSVEKICAQWREYIERTGK